MMLEKAAYDESLQMFQVRTSRFLADIETDLLDIEDAGDELPLELVNKVLRTVQSVKGGALFLGLRKVGHLANLIEHLLDLIRDRLAEPDAHTVNVMLGAFDLLERIIMTPHDQASEEMQKLVDQMEAIIAKGLPPEEQELVGSLRQITNSRGKVVFEMSEHYLHRTGSGGNFIYLVEYDLIGDVQDKGSTPFELIDFLEKSGLILDCRLETESVDSLDGVDRKRIPFYILFASILEPDMVRALFDLDESYITLVQGDDMVEAIEPGHVNGQPGTQAHMTTPGKESAEREMDESLELARMAWEEELRRQNGEDSAEEKVADADVATGQGHDQKDAAPAIPEEDEEVFPLQSLESTTGGRLWLELRGSLTIDRAAALRAALDRALRTGQEVVVDAAAVERVDLAGLQVLWAAFRKAKEKGVSMAWAGEVPEVIVRSSRLAGFGTSAAVRYDLEHFQNVVEP